MSNKARLNSIDAWKVICHETGTHPSSEMATKILDILQQERVKQDIITRQACADKIEQLKREMAYLDAKIQSATTCHPRAVQFLLDEAKHRTHFGDKDA